MGRGFPRPPRGILTPEVLRALVDEGTSCQYLPAGEEARASPAVVEALSRALAKQGLSAEVGATWTTDGVYRETPARVGRRREQGALVVEMEAASLFAVAAFRGVGAGALLYGADDLTGEEWDDRNWRNLPELRAQMLWLAADALTLETG